jgi:hypothetical protein
MNWAMILTGFIGFLLGNIARPLFGEVTKDLYAYYFRGGKKEKKIKEDVEIIITFLKDNKGMQSTKEIHSKIFTDKPIDYVYTLLKRASDRGKVNKGYYMDSEAHWMYIDPY